MEKLLQQLLSAEIDKKDARIKELENKNEKDFEISAKDLKREMENSFIDTEIVTEDMLFETITKDSGEWGARNHLYDRDQLGKIKYVSIGSRDFMDKYKLLLEIEYPKLEAESRHTKEDAIARFKELKGDE